VRRHRTRLHYEIQYAFLSGCGTPGSIPLWMPFTAGGVANNRDLFAQSGLLQSSLLLLGPAWKGADFQPLFFAGILVEELLFLVGCWLLARRLFRSPATAFFVGVSALGSAFWLDQVELNFRTIFAVPLLLEFTHRAFHERSLKHHFLAGNLIWIQMLGSPPGAGFAGALAPGLYLLARAFVRREPIRSLFPEGIGPRILAAVAGGQVIALPVALTALLGSGTPAAPNDLPPLRNLLVHAGLSNPFRYLDLLLGVSPSLDWSLYCGALTLGFALVALLTLPRPLLLRLLVAVPAAMLFLGVFLTLLFLFVPAPHPASPLPYGTPLVRLFVVFLAGAGFQRALEDRKSARLRGAGILLLAGAVLAAALSWNYTLNREESRDLLALLAAGEHSSATASAVLEPWIYPGALRFSLGSDLLGASALFAALAGGLLLLLGGRSRGAPLALTLILFVHPLDAFSWKFRMSWLETFPATASQRQLQRIEPAPFAFRRVPSLAEAPRYQTFHRIEPNAPNPEQVARQPDDGAANAYWWADVDETPGAVVGDKLRVTASPGGDSNRLSLAPAVESFGPNHLRLRVDSAPSGARLSYADAWSPGWTATVNGTARPIDHGNPKVKALSLDAGTNIVDFRYASPLRTLSFILVALNSLTWLLWTLATTFRLALRGRVDA